MPDRCPAQVAGQGTAEETPPMFHPDTPLDLPLGCDLLAELGVDCRTVREIAGDERAIRCPDRGAACPVHGFASLFPEPGGVAPSGKPEVEEGLKRLNGRGVGGVTPAPVVRNPSSSTRT